jgi:hypothetical protein
MVIGVGSAWLMEKVRVEARSKKHRGARSRLREEEFRKSQERI